MLHFGMPIEENAFISWSLKRWTWTLIIPCCAFSSARVEGSQMAWVRLSFHWEYLCHLTANGWSPFLWRRMGILCHVSWDWAAYVCGLWGQWKSCLRGCFFFLIYSCMCWFIPLLCCFAGVFNACKRAQHLQGTAAWEGKRNCWTESRKEQHEGQWSSGLSVLCFFLL